MRENSNRKILDCESFQSTASSLSAIFEIDSSTLLQTLQDVNFESLWEPKSREISFQDFLLDYFVNDLGAKTDIDVVCWFHLTRTLSPEGFKEGIYPLGMIIDNLYEDIYPLVSDIIPRSQWNILKMKNPGGDNAWLYAMKTKNIAYHGPYAMLVKEIAFATETTGYHDYLRIPEIIEDIGIGIHDKFGIELNKLFIQHSTPIIVKFNIPMDEILVSINNNYVLQPALYYLYLKVHKERLGDLCNTCFDAGNKVITKNRILNIEIVNEK